MSHPSHPAHPEDLARAQRMLAGDQASYRLFFDEVFPRLYRFCLRQCGQSALAEEVTQSSLVTALEGLHRYRGEASLLSWCFGIARHTLRRQQAVAARSLQVDDEDELDALMDALRPDAVDDPAQVVEADQLRDFIHAVLDRLPAPYAEVLEGRYVLGLSVRELAGQLGRSEKAVESALSRAREAFRQAFSVYTRTEVSP
jgi:RNA polymerase sigma-70 factor (ECF subfamily)